MIYVMKYHDILPFTSFTLPPSPSHFFPPASAVNGQLTITPLPDILFQNNSGVHNIVEQSVIWLYCTADSSNATITWTKDGVTLVNDPAHIRIRSSSSGMSTTSSLVVNNFRTSDNGNYVCQARDGIMTVNSSILSLTGGYGCEPSLVPKPSITANVMEGLVKLLCRMTSGGCLEAWHFW